MKAPAHEIIWGILNGWAKEQRQEGESEQDFCRRQGVRKLLSVTLNKVSKRKYVHHGDCDPIQEAATAFAEGQGFGIPFGPQNGLHTAAVNLAMYIHGLPPAN